MAGRLTNVAILAALLIALPACKQTATKADEQPIDLAVVYGLAATAYGEQNWGEAEKHYRTLTQAAPIEVEPWFKLGNIYARTLRPKLAIKFYREALVRDSQYIKAWHNMAVMQLREAGKSFAELELLVEPGDALYKKSIKIQKAINELVN
jgi:Flp pilus assembly protein TadD